MAEESNNKKKYGVAEIQSYYDGKLTPQEMHEMEKAALEDSFLADAMEGYTHSSTPDTDVYNLKSRLRDRQQNRNGVIPINNRKEFSQLVRMAAMFVIILGIGWIVYKYAFNKPETNISLNKETNIPEPVTSSNADTVNDQTPMDQAPPSSSAKEENKRIDNTVGIVNTTKSKIREKKELKEEQMATAETLNAPGQFDVSDEATVMAAPQGEATTSRQIPVNDSSFIAKRSMRGKIEKYDNNKIEIANYGNQVIITIKEDQDGVKELVLKKQKTDIIIKKKPSIIIEEAEPEESWSKFGEYISENLPDDFTKDSLKGTVKLSFEVNASGKPVNIHVEKSLCEKCDAEALRLLKEGPKWKKKIKRGKVSFSF